MTPVLRPCSAILPARDSRPVALRGARMCRPGIITYRMYLFDVESPARGCGDAEVGDLNETLTGKRSVVQAVTASVAMYPGMTTVTSPSAKTASSVSRHQSRASSAPQAPRAMALSTLTSLSM
jgi:hypothetical protein